MSAKNTKINNELNKEIEKKSVFYKYIFLLEIMFILCLYFVLYVQNMVVVVIYSTFLILYSFIKGVLWAMEEENNIRINNLYYITSVLVFIFGLWYILGNLENVEFSWAMWILVMLVYICTNTAPLTARKDL